MPDNKIFLEYDQAGLDAQYNNRLRWPDYKVHFANWRTWSTETCAKLPCHLDLAFGPAPMEKLDLFPSETPGAPLYVFIHGGYWYSLDKADYSYVAEGFRPHGIATAVNNFGLAPDTGMDEIVRQNRAALAWLWRNARTYGADPDRIYVCGHSAGGHLAVMLLATDWPAFGAGLPKDLVKGACSIGGLFDMEAIRLSFLNKTLKMRRRKLRATRRCCKKIIQWRRPCRWWSRLTKHPSTTANRRQWPTSGAASDILWSCWCRKGSTTSTW